ncbi:growth hormone receptor-like [Morphnus guianensis]
MLREGAAGIFTTSLGCRGAPEVEECKDYVTAGPNSCYFSRENFCLYLTYEIWVEAEGWVSERLVVNTGDIAKTDPPRGVTASGGGTYLSVDWQYPPGIAPSYFPLLFQLRYREVGSSVWVVSPLSFPARTPSRCNNHRPIRAKVLGSCDRLGGKSGWRSSSLKHQTPEKTSLRSSKAAPGASPQTALASLRGQSVLN